MEDKIDKETAQQLSRGEEIQRMTQSIGWSYARELLVDKLLDYQSVNNIETEDPEQVIREIGIRRGVVSTVYEWLKEIEGESEQHETNSEMFEGEEAIRRY